MPPIPKGIKRRGPNRNCLDGNQVRIDAQIYNFNFVWKWPQGKPQMVVINEWTVQTHNTNTRRVSQHVTDKKFSVQYKKVNGVLTNGLCGYSCMAYSVSGDARAYVPVIDDCLDALEWNPALFNLYEPKWEPMLILLYIQNSNEIDSRDYMHGRRASYRFSLMFDISIFVHNATSAE